MRSLLLKVRTQIPGTRRISVQLRETLRCTPFCSEALKASEHLRMGEQVLLTYSSYGAESAACDTKIRMLGAAALRSLASCEVRVEGRTQLHVDNT